MSFEDTIGAIVEAAVARAVAPLAAEVARLRQEAEKPLSIEQAAARLGISERTVRRRVKDGSLPATRVGARVLVQVGAVLPSSDQVVSIAHRARRR